MRRLRVNPIDTSYAELTNIARKCGFSLSGTKHCKVKTMNGAFVTTIPRHPNIKRETAKDILERFILFGADIEIVN